jgi:trans-aconitate methyltransferase
MLREFSRRKQLPIHLLENSRTAPGHHKLKYSEEVKISEATALIHTPLIEWARLQSWCDLGCGSGTFTTALAQLLAPGSMIHAVDLDPRALEYVPDHYDRVEIRKTLGDIGSPSLRLPPVDGILMANTLHFIKEQQALMRRLLSVTDCFLIVEMNDPSRTDGDHIRWASKDSANSSPRQEWNEWRNWQYDPRCLAARCTRLSSNAPEHNAESF